MHVRHSPNKLPANKHSALPCPLCPAPHHGAMPHVRRSTKCVIASAGMQADRQALHKLLHTRHVTYQFAHRKPMSANAVAQLLSTTLYNKRFFPFYTFNLCAGLDEQGRWRANQCWGLRVGQVHLRLLHGSAKPWLACSTDLSEYV